MISACPACAAAPLAQDIAMAQPMMQFSLPTIHCAACIGKIALPVVAFSGQPFFHNAWQALRVGRLNMDVPISLAIILAAAFKVWQSGMLFWSHRVRAFLWTVR